MIQQTTFKSIEEAKDKTLKVEVSFYKGRTFVNSKGESNHKDMYSGSETIEIGNLERFLIYDTIMWTGYYVSQSLLAKCSELNNPKYWNYHHIGVCIKRLND